MNCDFAETLIMKHMECTITEDESKALYAHTLECENCKEYYLAFDEVMEFAANDNTLWIEAPVNFTANVMAEVTKAPIYAKAAQPEVEKARSQMMFHILWGVSAIMLGVALFFVYNPAHFDGLIERLPALASASAWVSSVWAAISGGMDRVMQNNMTIESNLGVTALLIVLIIASLLVALHRSEKVSE